MTPTKITAQEVSILINLVSLYSDVILLDQSIDMPDDYREVVFKAMTGTVLNVDENGGTWSEVQAHSIELV